MTIFPRGANWEIRLYAFNVIANGHVLLENFDYIGHGYYTSLSCVKQYFQLYRSGQFCCWEEKLPQITIKFYHMILY